jgi:transcription antitermination factor NusG
MASKAERMEPEQLQWYAIRSILRGEFTAERELRGLGYDAYCPAETKWRTHAGRKDAVAYPYFARYLFVGMPADDLRFPDIRTSKGVERIIGTPKGPLRIPYKEISKWRAMQARGDWDQTKDHTTLVIEPGQPVNIIGGPYTGCTLQIVECKDGEERALVLMQMFAAWHDVSIDKRDIEKLDDAA